MIHEGIGDFNAIAKVAMAGVEVALKAGWNVSCIAKRLDARLIDRVTWHQLHVPGRVFLYKWLTARHYIKKAMGDKLFDVVHAHQPQVADLSDIFQCHFLTRMLLERHCTDQGDGPRGFFRGAQERAVVIAEGFQYRHWRPQTRMLFNSEGTRNDFTRLFGQPPLNDVLPCPMPRQNIADAAERRAAKESFFGSDCGLPVVGFLGGEIKRKGIQRLLAAASVETGLRFLVGGSGSEIVAVPPKAAARCKQVGLITDLDRFYAACDVLLVCSFYEPLGLVAFESVARGTPVIATPEVGALPHLLKHGVGSRWQPGEPLLPIVRDILARPERIPSAVDAMEAELGPEQYGRQLLEFYDRILKEKAHHAPQQRLVAETV